MIPSTEGDRVGQELVGDRPTPDDRPERPPVRLGEVDSARLGGQQVHRVLGDLLEDGGRVERRRDLPADVGQGRHLLGSPVRLAVQPGVLDRRRRRWPRWS